MCVVFFTSASVRVFITLKVYLLGEGEVCAGGPNRALIAGDRGELVRQLHLRGTGIACSMCTNPTQCCLWHGGCHTSVPSVPGSTLSQALCSGAAVLAVPMTVLTARSLMGQGHTSLLKEG